VIKIKEEKIKGNKKNSSLLIKLLFFLLFCATGVFMFWTKQVSNVENSTLVMWLVLSVLTNIFIIVLLLGTFIGIELIKRFINKFRYKTGNYVNTLHVMKSGVIKERFIKKDKETGTFRMVDKPYVTNARLMFIYKGIPTYVHREGNPDPVNIWEENYGGDLSNSEMDIAMNSKGAFDVKQWLEKNKMVIFIGLLVVVGVTIAAAFFGYQSWEMLRDGTFKQITEVTCKNMPKAAEVVATTIGEN